MRLEAEPKTSSRQTFFGFNLSACFQLVSPVLTSPHDKPEPENLGRKMALGNRAIYQNRHARIIIMARRSLSYYGRIHLRRLPFVPIISLAVWRRTIHFTNYARRR